MSEQFNLFRYNNTDPSEDTYYDYNLGLHRYRLTKKELNEMQEEFKRQKKEWEKTHNELMSERRKKNMYESSMLNRREKKIYIDNYNYETIKQSMNQIIEEIYQEVKRRCYLPTNAYGIGAWDHHIEVVYKLAIENCEQYHANHDIVALASLLHDIASVTNKDYTEEHHIIGARIAEEMLEKYELNKDDLELIKKCILNHRGSRLVEKTTPEEICIADSDAMAHFYSVASLLRMVYVEKNMGIDEGADFVLHKLERSYIKLSPKGKKIILPQYEAAKILLIKK